jgi:hypothetical protein
VQVELKLIERAALFNEAQGGIPEAEYVNEAGYVGL